LAQHIKSGNFYALKRMKKKTYNGLIKFVITEKEVQRKLSHPFICKLHFAFQSFDHLYLVSDYCAAGDLRSLLNENEYLPEEEAVKFLAEILVAIEDIHKNGIIHRDIKPENILIDAEGHAKLSDFGLAKEGLFD
jgi:serine/threonine protein kinase